MTLADYTYLLNKPELINEKQTEALAQVLEDFPYFQSARAIRLKGLFNQNSFRYNYALKVTAAHTTDRTVLFDFITSDGFASLEKENLERNQKETAAVIAIKQENIQPETTVPPKINSLEQSIRITIKEATNHTTIADTNLASENLEMGTPLGFSKDEKHSFQEWLQLSRAAPIERSIDRSTQMDTNDEEKKKKLELIDNFIAASPKISPVKNNIETPAAIDVSKTDHSFLMTETLARVYLEQKKYLKAIQAYEILILKYPEKSSLFANRIADIKSLQQNNNN